MGMESARFSLSCCFFPSCDLLEQPAAEGRLPLEQRGIRLSFTPFHVLSVLLVLRQ